MRKIIALCFAFILVNYAFSQPTLIEPYSKDYDETPKLFFGLSSGINNSVGVLGLQMDAVIDKNMVLGVGIGLSSWGYKMAAYFQSYSGSPYKFYGKGGLSWNSGLPDFEVELELKNGDMQDVMMDLNPVTNGILALGYAWKVGRRNKIYLEGGYAINLKNKDYYTLIDDSVELSSTSERVLRVLRPGGLIISLGFNFAIGN